jgi:hypothetical protein
MRPAAASLIALLAAAAACQDLLDLGPAPTRLRPEDAPDATIGQGADASVPPDVSGADVDGVAAQPTDVDLGGSEAPHDHGAPQTGDDAAEEDGGSAGSFDSPDDASETSDGPSGDGDTVESSSAPPLVTTEAPDCNPMGFRHGAGSSIVYRDPANDVIELEWSGTAWSAPRDLSRLAGAKTTAVGNAFGYTRPDGSDSVVYLGADYDIHEITRGPSGWQDTDLAVAAGLSGGMAAGDPFAFVRSDGASAVAYRTTDGHVHELAHPLVSVLDGGPDGGRAWADTDFSRGVFPPEASTPVTAPGAGADPVGFLRADGVDSVAYAGFDREIYLITPNDAGARDLEDIVAATGCWSVGGNIHYYSSPMASSSVVYRDSNQTTPTIWNLVFQASTGGWACYDVTDNSTLPAVVATGGDPVPNMRADQIADIVLRTSNNHVFEYAFIFSTGTWLVDDLTAITHAPEAVGNPVGYIKDPMTTAIVFRSRADNSTVEIEINAIPGSVWTRSDFAVP